MEKLIAIYERFVKLLLQYKESGEEIPGFVQLCARRHVSPTSLNSVILDQTGMTGEDLIEDLRAAREKNG